MAFQKRLGLKTPWQIQDAQWVRQTFSTVEGQRFLNRLYSRRPKATEKSDATKRLIQSGAVEGFEEFFNLIEFLGHPDSIDKTPSTTSNQL